MITQTFSESMDELDIAVTKLIRQRDELAGVLEMTAQNIRSLKASCNCTTYDMWLSTVMVAIAKAKAGAK